MSFLREPNSEPIPGYRLIEPLGSGGFGEAWKCEAPGGLFKAIKFVFGNLNSLDCDGARAEQERKALDKVKAIRHPFVLQMDRIEIANGELVIVMELADKSLHDAFEESRGAGLVGIPRDTLLGYIRDAAEALDHMNEQYGLQHLDIKPRNLFLVSNRVKVADFGLVKALERSDASGLLGGVTPLYAPPETFTNQISAHSDQYSLAIVYQELLTGHRPFNGKNARQLAHQHMNEAPDLRALPEPERPILARALEKDPARRFPNCLAFVRALYSARAPSFARGHDDGGKRPKTMVDTLEDLVLEGRGSDHGRAPEAALPLAAINESGEAVGQLGVTVAAPSTGSLRPTILIGIGGYGRRALTELRCRFLDRFGDLDKVPLVRFLYVDSDPEALKLAQRGAAEIAFRSSEVYHLPLQPVSHYRRRQIDQLADWLPREKLYSVPRNLKTQGARALGRLAFTDNYLRLMAKLKREVQLACNSDAIFQTVQQTGLALRDNVPRVYVVASATGGASGYLADLGYAARRLLAQLQQPESSVVSFLFCGAPDDPATPREEQANLYATLTELHHFSDPSVRFSAQYGTDGPRLVDEGAAFDQVYLLSQPHRSPEGRRDVISHVGSYLFHEVTTPLGLRLDQGRLKKNPSRPFRSLGTFGVWFPRGLLLRLAAREACSRLMDEWQSGAGAALTGPEQALVGAAEARALAGSDLAAEALANRLGELAGEHMDSHPREALTRLLLQVEEQSTQPVAQEDPGAWARQALHKVRDWLGSGVAVPGVNAIQQRRSQLTRALEAASTELAAEWDARFGDAIVGLMDHAGRRVALAEAAVARFIHFCDDASRAQQEVLKKQAALSQRQLEQLDTALQNCITGAGGWSLFGGRSRRLLRVFVDHLTAHARQCLAEDTATAVLQFFALLRGRLADRLRDLGFSRQRLRHLQEALSRHDDDDEGEVENVVDTATFTRHKPLGARGASGAWRAVAPSTGLSQTPLLSTETYWQSIRESHTNRVVLPDGAADLAQAARRFLATLSPEHWAQLDLLVGEQVLAPHGGLLKLCMDNSDVVRFFLAPLLNQAIGGLSLHLPITDVAQVELSGPTEGQLADRLGHYYSSALPLLTTAEAPAERRAGSGARRAALVAAGGLPPTPQGVTGRPAPPGGKGQFGYLLVPASEAGRAFGESARRVMPELDLVNVPGQADLMFCREQSALGVEDLERILQSSRNAYYEATLTVQTSPHARFDIHDWAPLDP